MHWRCCQFTQVVLVNLAQLKSVANAADGFFELPAETKKLYVYGGKEMHGWMSIGQEV